jgi:uncharacterized protein (DUF302 family)
MTNATKFETPFEGLRIQARSKKTHDQLLLALLADIGKTPVSLEDLAKNHPDWESYSEEVKRLTGPSGFILFGLIDHGAWLSKKGSFPQATRVILGNPLIAITMLRHDIRAGLFAPVELLIYEQEEGSSIMYVQPSSLMAVEPDEGLLKAASILDQKLEALVLKCASD